MTTPSEDEFLRHVEAFKNLRKDPAFMARGDQQRMAGQEAMATVLAIVTEMGFLTEQGHLEEAFQLSLALALTISKFVEPIKSLVIALTATTLADELSAKFGSYEALNKAIENDDKIFAKEGTKDDGLPAV